MAIRMTLSDLQGHSPTASLFKCDLLYSYAAVDKISTDLVHRTFRQNNYGRTTLQSNLSLEVEIWKSQSSRIKSQKSKHDVICHAI